MFKKFFAVLFVSFFVLVFYYTEIAFAQSNQGTVSATVTAQNVSISVSSGIVTYGVMAVNTHKSTIPAELDQRQTISNTGNVSVNINIRSGNSTNWALASTPGVDQYVHMFCHTSCDTPPTNYTALTDSNQTFQNSVGVSENRSLDLRLSTPTSTTHFGEQSMTVTVQASAA